MKPIIRTILFGKKSPIGDRLPRATVAYSLRKLYKVYTGFAITVRRSSDNALQDIGFLRNGDLDVSSLLAFVGASNGFVQTWYDQSGNGYNQIQNTSANQYQIVASGNVNLQGLRPALLFAGSQFSSTSNWSNSNLFGANPMTMNLVGVSTNTGDQDLLSYGSPAVLTLRSLGMNFTSWRSTVSGDISNASVTAQTYAVVTNTWDGTTSTLFTQGVSRGTSTGAENTPSTELFIGQRSSNASRFSGNLTEAWIFNTPLSTADRQVLERNQGSYYTITVA